MKILRRFWRRKSFPHINTRTIVFFALICNWMPTNPTVSSTAWLRFPVQISRYLPSIFSLSFAVLFFRNEPNIQVIFYFLTLHCYHEGPKKILSRIVCACVFAIMKYYETDNNNQIITYLVPDKITWACFQWTKQ